MYSIEIYFTDGSVHYFEQCSVSISRSIVFVVSDEFYFEYELRFVSSISFSGV